MSKKKFNSRSRFDLEQEIQAAWMITDDIKLIYRDTENLNMDADSTDRIQNQLLGLQSLYELKFARLWDTFEKLVEEGIIK